MLLVSIHDVTPALEHNVTRLWQLCADRGVTPALLLVPNWHGAWPLEQHPEFMAWVRDRADEGAEVVLHGERHDEVGLHRGLGDRWRAWGKTDGEGEFLSLDGPAARDRLMRALERLRRLGVKPVGFVPPAWLAREVVHQAAAAAGLSFSEDDRSVRLLPSGHRIPSPVVRWSTRSRTRAWGSVAVAKARWVLQRKSQCPRIALHPPDLDYPATARSIGHNLDRWLGQHRAGRYADLNQFPRPA
jgi:uncharacterized protein